MNRAQKVAAAVGISIAAVATPFIASHEGLRTTAYRDVVGVPTVCFGETLGVKMGDKYTRAECEAMLSVRVEVFEAAARKCVTPAVWDKLPVKTRVANVSLAYNIGSSAHCGSTVVKRLKAGDIRGACNAFMSWNKGRINGKLQVIKGLTNRRAEERTLCLADV